MASLWTDVVDPATLTGYARESLAAYEARKGTLARWLPNREVSSTNVRFVAGQAGLVEEARYRDFDAEPEVGKPRPGRRVSIELPAVSQEIPVGEYQQLMERQASTDAMLRSVLTTTDDAVRAIADRVERTRGVVIATGKATVDQGNFYMDDDFGRAAEMTVTAPTLFSDSSADAMGYLETLLDLYRDQNGDEPGSIVASSKVIRALQGNKAMATLLPGGATRPATEGELRATLTGAGLPDLIRFDRRTSAGKVLPDTHLFLLPAPVDTDDWAGTQLGATFWGQTLTSVDPRYGIADSEMPGIVAGVYRNDKPPLIGQIVADSINLPVLSNANLSLAAKVL